MGGKAGRIWKEANRPGHRQASIVTARRGDLLIAISLGERQRSVRVSRPRRDPDRRSPFGKNMKPNGRPTVSLSAGSGDRAQRPLLSLRKVTIKARPGHRQAPIVTARRGDVLSFMRLHAQTVIKCTWKVGSKCQDSHLTPPCWMLSKYPRLHQSALQAGQND